MLVKVASLLHQVLEVVVNLLPGERLVDVRVVLGQEFLLKVQCVHEFFVDLRNINLALLFAQNRVLLCLFLCH